MTTVNREDATAILVSKGYSGDEARKILDEARVYGTALTVPRDCPSLWVTSWYQGSVVPAYRIQENDSGEEVTF